MATNPTLAAPLTDADYRKLNQAQFMMNQLLTRLDQAEAAGIDVTEQRLRRDDISEQIDRLKRAFFSDKK